MTALAPSTLTLATVERVVVFGLIAELLRRERHELERKERLATTDPLTGLLNRRALWSEIETEIARSHRHRRPLACFVVDLDGLKAVNDHEGHAAGDALIRRFADIVAPTLRRTDRFARIGGDEFVILLPETTFDEAHAVAHRIQRLLHTTPGRSVRASVGGVVYDIAPGTAEDLVRLADQALYVSKHRGGDTIELNADHTAPRDDSDQGLVDI